MFVERLNNQASLYSRGILRGYLILQSSRHQDVTRKFKQFSV